MPELYPEDQEKVDKYLQTPGVVEERNDFKPLRLLFIIFIVLGLITGVSYLVAVQHGVI